MSRACIHRDCFVLFGDFDVACDTEVLLWGLLIERSGLLGGLYCTFPILLPHPTELS